ncbi:dihydrofolate reductase-like domain-containing protein, partial [Dichotomocladium elegans]
DRPYITLTYAQSLDGKIAAKEGQQLLLSGAESMAMTHRLRLLHDGILVGVRTVVIDNPQLNARHALQQDIEHYGQPRPIVVDTRRLEFPATCKLVQNYKQGTGKQPWVFTTTDAPKDKLLALEEAGVCVIQVSPGKEKDHRPDWASVLRKLRDLGIERLMIEGGAKVIQTSQTWADQWIVTTAPVMVGANGIAAAIDPVRLDHVVYRQFGMDIVMAAK